MASEEDALDELRSKSASISTKIKEIKAICVHCNRKVIEFVKCAKCKDIFHPSCLTQAATKKSTLCIHESEISEEISEDPRVLLHIFQVRIQYLESLLSETQSKNSILVQNNELLTEKVRNLESSKKNENQQQKKPESRDKDHSQSQPSHISSMIESTSVVQKSSVNEQKGQNRQSDKLTYSSKVNKGLNSSNKVLKNMLPSTSTTDVTAIPNENYNENKTIVENNKNKDITTPEQINSGWKTAVSDYHTIITRPMDLQTIRENLRQKKYTNREEFLCDVNQIVENSTLYNGASSSLTLTSQRMLNKCLERLSEKEDRLMRLEKAINPLLDDNDQVALTFILDNVLNHKLKPFSDAWPFLKPVNKKCVKDYYTIVKKPMDLETIGKKVSAHKYHSRYEFLEDVQLILENCALYNGKDAAFTKQAEDLVKICKFALQEFDDHLGILENKISLVKEKAYQEDDQAWMGTEEENFTITEPDRMSQMSSPDGGSFMMKSSMDEMDYVDVEGEHPSQFSSPSKDRLTKKVKRESATLEEDLQFSSEEELDEVPLHEFEDSKGDFLIPAELPLDGNAADDDSQQVAEAMVQLGSMAYYQNEGEVGDNIMYKEDESMDLDPNYDPSDFLMSGLQKTATEVRPHDQDHLKIHDDLAVSDSDEEMPSQENMNEDDGGELWF